MKEKLAHYFATYKNNEYCYSTSDGQLFHKKSDAIAHGNTLGNKSVTEHSKAEASKKEAPVKELKPEGKPEGEKKPAEDKTKKPE